MRDTCTDESAISNDNRTAYAAARIANLVLSIKSRRASISCRTLEEPLRQIVTHSSEDPSVIVAKVTEGTGNFGYYEATGEYRDLVETGVFDPTKVTRTALQNAASVASLMLTTDATVYEAPKDAAPSASPAGPGAGGPGFDF